MTARRAAWIALISLAAVVVRVNYGAVAALGLVLAGTLFALGGT